MKKEKELTLKELYPYRTTIASIFEEDFLINKKQIDIIYEYIDEIIDNSYRDKKEYNYSNKTSYYQYFQDMTINEIEKHIALILLTHS